MAFEFVLMVIIKGGRVGDRTYIRYGSDAVALQLFNERGYGFSGIANSEKLH
jgi:hypothetical protein